MTRTSVHRVKLHPVINYSRILIDVGLDFTWACSTQALQYTQCPQGNIHFNLLQVLNGANDVSKFYTR